MAFKKIQILLLFLCIQVLAFSQDNLYTSYTTPAKRSELYRRLVQNSINKNLKLPLNDSTEEKYTEAFSALELIKYHSPLVDKKVFTTMDSIDSRTRLFKRSFLELIFANYPGTYAESVKRLTFQNADTKLFAMASEYLLQFARDSSTVPHIKKMIGSFPPEDATDIYLEILRLRLNEFEDTANTYLKQRGFLDIFKKTFLPGETVVYSFQRRDRNYPGLLVIRDMDGNYVKDSDGNIFNIPQLARSITNLPYYITNGNTPQGIFNMHGFDVSKSSFIGPTPNIQLSMPVEMGKKSFFRDSSRTDTGWVFSDYSQLLPLNVRSYLPLYGSYYAGQAGRTEIISHGTTIDPEYYRGQPYYPQTPSQGCLCTKEVWNGKRLDSDQLKLVNALLTVGGAKGYLVVLELDNKKTPVTINDVSSFIQMAESLK